MPTQSSAPVEIADGVYRIPWELGIRRIAQWVVLSDDRILLIDTGVPGTIRDHVAPALKALGRDISEVTDVLISHADVDHYGDNGGLRDAAPQARIRSSATDRPLIETWERIYADRYSWYQGHGMDYDPDTMQWLHDAAGRDVPLDGTVAEGDVLDVGATSLRVLELPGHSAGHLGFLIEGTGCVVAVDSVLERGLYDVDENRISPPPYVTASGYRDSIAKLKSLNLDRLETAHYREITGADVEAFLTASDQFAADLERVIRGELGDGPRTVKELTAVADRELGPFSEMGVELARSVGAHLDDLVETGEARRRDGSGFPTWIAD